MLLAEVASAADVAAIRGELRTVMFWGCVLLITACAWFGVDAVRKWLKAKFDELLLILNRAASPNTPVPEMQESRVLTSTTPAIPTIACGFDAAAQTLLRQTASDTSVKSMTMTVDKSDGIYSLNFAAKGAAANG